MGRLYGAPSGGMGAVAGITPHVLHHVGPIAGAALLTGTGGSILFGALGFVLTLPLLWRLKRRFGTWLARIVINEALGRLRRRHAPLVALDSVHERPSGEVIPFPLLTDNSDPERTMAQRQILALLEGAIDELPDAFRTVLIARVIEEMSVEETAQLLDLRPETVKTRLHRARALLKDALEKQIGPMVTEAFPFDGKRCERMADAVVARLGL